MAESNKFEDLLKELADEGSIDKEAFDRITEASKGSPLRRERDDAVRRAETAEAQAKTYRDGAIKAQLAKHELKLNPAALNLPDDLDVTDDKAMRDWLVTAGAIEDTEKAEIDAELEQHEHTAEAAATGETARTTGKITPADVASWPTDKAMRFKNRFPEEFELLKRGEEVTAVGFN